MNTDILEQQAMNKIYNHEAPDELKDSKIPENNDEQNKYDFVAKILESHEGNYELKKMDYGNDFSYLKIKENPWQWHLIKFFDSKYGMLLSSDYLINYSSTKHNSEVEGMLSFQKEKEYLLEYRRESLEDFERQMLELKEVSKCLDTFKTDRQQIFYEYQEFIYLYQDNYVWKLSGYTRNDVTEYYQMYLFLMSLEPLIQRKYQNNKLLKYLYLVEKNAMDYLYKGIDLKKRTLASLTEEFQQTLDVVTVSLDNNCYIELLDLDYLLFRRRKGDSKEEIPITIYHKISWFFEGTFKLGLLGKFINGELLEYNSIFNSTEISEIERKELLKKVVIEKKEECLEKKDYLNAQFLKLFFRKEFENIEESFEKNNWLTFFKVESMPIQELSLEEVKGLLIILTNQIKNIQAEDLEESKEWKEFLSYLDYSALRKNMKPLYLTITPLFIVVECNLFGEKKNYVITEDYQVIEW